SGPANARVAGARSSCTQRTIASAKLQRTIAGGVTATRVLSVSHTASSRTTSSTLHSPGPTGADSDGATANCAVSRSRHAEGGAGSSALISAGGSGISAGRGRGNGIVLAAAKPQVAKPKRASRMKSAERAFTAVISARIATLWGPFLSTYRPARGSSASLFSEPSLDQRLIRNVLPVGCDLDALQEGHRQSQRNRRCRRLQVWQAHPFGLAPVDILVRCVGFPKLPFLHLVLEARNGLTFLAHSVSVLSRSLFLLK